MKNIQYTVEEKAAAFDRLVRRIKKECKFEGYHRHMLPVNTGVANYGANRAVEGDIAAIDYKLYSWHIRFYDIGVGTIDAQLMNL